MTLSVIQKSDLKSGLRFFYHILYNQFFNYDLIKAGD